MWGDDLFDSTIQSCQCCPAKRYKKTVTLPQMDEFEFPTEMLPKKDTLNYKLLTK